MQSSDFFLLTNLLCAALWILYLILDFWIISGEYLSSSTCFRSFFAAWTNLKLDLFTSFGILADLEDTGVESWTDLLKSSADWVNTMFVVSSSIDIDFSDEVFSHSSLILGRWAETRDSYSFNVSSFQRIVCLVFSSLGAVRFLDLSRVVKSSSGGTVARDEGIVARH